MVYTEEGQQAMESLWEETLEEFSFARAREILGGMKKK
jgi:hypothetical protein